MLTKEVSQKYLNDALISIHSKRSKSLFETAWALTGQANLTISSLGYNKDGSAYVKHKIKSVDRLVGNDRLHKEIPIIYKEFFQPFIATTKIIYLIIDWSGCCRDDIHMLRASMMFDGRSITIYNEIHPLEKLGNRQIHSDFLRRLKKQIPIDKKVVVITDAGFSTPWFNSVLKVGWDYIGRLKSDTKLLFEEKLRWMRVKNLHKKASLKVRYAGKATIGSSSSTPVEGNIYSYKVTPKKRQCQSRYPDVNKRYTKANKRPWILATSLKNHEYGKHQIKNLYANRMQIEQNFRDDKDPRFGFGWRFGKSNCMKRMAVLCLLAHIAAFFLLSIGIIAERLGLHRQFQVNSERKKRVLSFLFLGKQIIRRNPPLLLDKYYQQAAEQLMTSYEGLYLC